MMCPNAEVLSRWIDGALDAPEAAAVEDHAKGCEACAQKAEELVAVGSLIRNAAEPGPSCLSVDDMAAVLESGRTTPHLRTCPRCAAEYKALKPEKETKRATRRREKPAAPARAWAVAAAIFVAVGILLVVAVRQHPSPDVDPWAFRKPTPADPYVPQPLPPVPQVPAPKQPVTPPQVVVETPVPPPVPQKETPAPVTPPAPVVEQPVAPEVTPPPVREPQKGTVAEAARTVAALNLRVGSLSALTTQGKWLKTDRYLEGMTLRADQKTQIEFAQAKVTVDRDSRFSVSKEEFALLEGTMSAEVSAGGHFVLVLDEQRFFPQTQNARVLLCAKPDRLFIEEGGAKWRDTWIREGAEYGVKKDSVEARKGRPFASSRKTETTTWRMDLSNLSAAKAHVIGRIDNSPEGRMLVSDPSKDGIFYGLVNYNNGGELPVFTVKPNTAIRIHYYLREPAYLELVMWNGTKGENFNRTLDAPVRQWTTMTVYARDVAANRGGKPVTCEVGDKYTSIGMFVGKAGMPSEVYIDRLEILEIDR